MDLRAKLSASLYSAIVGDALGVPVEHATRQELALCAVKNMLGYGRYDQPKGTWSDDSSMILCSMESLSKGYDLNDLARTFCSWIFEGRWTATGFVFDSGLTTFQALESIWSDKKSPRESGRSSDDDNGNGSLMRALPIALYFAAEETPIMLEKIHETSAITHAHARAKLGCGIYALLVRELLKTGDKQEAYTASIKHALEYYESHDECKGELSHYMRILSRELPSVGKDDIRTTGYAVHTLEAAIWCFLNYDTTVDTLLAAVNLGLDTDTTGTVAGGLAGLVHGVDSIPEDWMKTVARKEDVDRQIGEFVEALLPRLNSLQT